MQKNISVFTRMREFFYFQLIPYPHFLLAMYCMVCCNILLVQTWPFKFDNCFQNINLFEPFAENAMD